MDKEPATRGKATVRILGIAWILYGVFLDADAATGIVFIVFGLLLLLLSELAMDALANQSISRRYKQRIGWW